jgi:plasmid stabilization system protein ParE
MGIYILTPTALKDLRRIGSEGRARWGAERNATYMRDLKRGFQHIADRHDALPERPKLTGASGLRLHRVGRHYIVFVVLTPDHVAITSVLHDHMDVPARLREMQALTDIEVGDVRAEVLRSLLKP